MSVKTTTLQSGKIGVIEVKGSLVGGEETDELRSAVADFVEQESAAVGTLEHAAGRAETASDFKGRAEPPGRTL